MTTGRCREGRVTVGDTLNPLAGRPASEDELRADGVIRDQQDRGASAPPFRGATPLPR